MHRAQHRDRRSLTVLCILDLAARQSWTHPRAVEAIGWNPFAASEGTFGML